MFFSSSFFKHKSQTKQHVLEAIEGKDLEPKFREGKDLEPKFSLGMDFGVMEGQSRFFSFHFDPSADESSGHL